MVYEVVSDKDKNIGRDRSKMDVFLVVQGHKSRIQSCYEVIPYLMQNEFSQCTALFISKTPGRSVKSSTLFPPKCEISSTAQPKVVRVKPCIARVG